MVRFDGSSSFFLCANTGWYEVVISAEDLGAYSGQGLLDVYIDPGKVAMSSTSWSAMVDDESSLSLFFAHSRRS